MRVCSIEGCHRKHWARGWCNLHYYRHKRYGDAVAGKPIITAANRIKVCTVEQCEKRIYGNGLCSAHNARLRKYGDPLGRAPERPKFCSVDGCDRPRCARGLCNSHWARWRKHGDPLTGGAIKSAGQPRTGCCLVESCTEKDFTRGLCQPHYTRLRKYGDPIHVPEPKRTPLEDRFLAKVNKDGPGGCWMWLGKLNLLGYGFINADDENGRAAPRPAHRVAYKIFVGIIPPGKHIDHKCRNRSCVNPAHLRPVTPKQNAENREYRSTISSRSGVRGVIWNEASRKWATRVTHNYRAFSVGYYNTVEEAAAAVAAKRRELFTHNDDDWSGVSAQLELISITNATRQRGSAAPVSKSESE